MAIPFRRDLTEFIDEFAQAHRGVRRGQMFGLPAIYVGRRLVACLIEDGVIVRLQGAAARREIRSKRGTSYSHGARDSRRWVMFRPRTAAAARSLIPVVETAAREQAERQTEDLTGIRTRPRNRLRNW